MSPSVYSIGQMFNTAACIALLVTIVALGCQLFRAAVAQYRRRYWLLTA